jgi:hypothetical protein
MSISFQNDTLICSFWTPKDIFNQPDSTVANPHYRKDCKCHPVSPRCQLHLRSRFPHPRPRILKILRFVQILLHYKLRKAMPTTRVRRSDPRQLPRQCRRRREITEAGRRSARENNPLLCRLRMAIRRAPRDLASIVFKAEI